MLIEWPDDDAGIDMTGRQRSPVAGEVPSPINPPSGCTFHPRCPLATDICRTTVPPLRTIDVQRTAACHLVRGADAPLAA